MPTIAPSCCYCTYPGQCFVPGVGGGGGGGGSGSRVDFLLIGSGVKTLLLAELNVTVCRSSCSVWFGFGLTFTSMQITE